MSIEEAVIRFSEIDKAEMRQAYLHFMKAEYHQLQKSITSQRKTANNKFQMALVREYLTSENEDQIEDQTEDQTDEDLADNLQPMEGEIGPWCKDQKI